MENKNFRKTKITISGMHCASCASNVEKALSKIKGVQSASVSIMTNKAIVEADEKTNPEEFKKAISNVGYEVIKIE